MVNFPDDSDFVNPPNCFFKFTEFFLAVLDLQKNSTVSRVLKYFLPPRLQFPFLLIPCFGVVHTNHMLNRY